MIEVKHLTKRYGNNTAVQDISFTIETGKIYGFLGPNGAGKSTTMNMLTGCLAMTEGEILIDGHDIVEDPAPAKRMIGYLPEQPPLYLDMTPVEYLTFVAKAKGVDPGHIADQVETAMKETHITSVKDRMIRNLSKGYKQRVGIAQAMLGDPKLIILDEPTVGLDPKQILEIRDLILELGKTRTVLLSSHILAEISAVCDHVMIISRGRLVANGTLEEIRRAHAQDNRLELEVKGNRQTLTVILSKLQNVESSEIVEAEKGKYRISIIVKGTKDIREEIFFAFAAAKCPILSMQSSALSLEDVFLKLTAEEIVPEDEEEADEPEDEDEDGENDDGDDDEYDDEDEEEDDEDDDYVPLFSRCRKDEDDDEEEDDDE